MPDGNLFISGGGILLCTCILWGCASPGPPRPPSLFVPRPASDLTATRSGDRVELHFTVPTLSTDGQPLRAHSLIGVLCRQDAKGTACQPVDTAETGQPISVPDPGGARAVAWTDPLPSALQIGSPRSIAYRVELKTLSGVSAGFSDPVYTAGGTAPPPVIDLRGEGSRPGVMLRWTPGASAGEVMLRRMGPQKNNPALQGTATQGDQGGHNSPVTKVPKAREHGRASRSGSRQLGEKHGSTDNTDNGVVWLKASPGADAAATIDNTIEPGVPYRYTAIRREQVQVGGRMLVLESRPSTEVAVTWRDVYPPAVPAGLTALGYQTTAGEPQASSSYAVDLVWQPVEDGQLAGYLVSRQTLGAGQAQPAVPMLLTPQPLATPGYHDATALPGQRYRYSVVAVGTNGQRSGAVTAVVEPHLVP